MLCNQLKEHTNIKWLHYPFFSFLLSDLGELHKQDSFSQTSILHQPVGSHKNIAGKEESEVGVFITLTSYLIMTLDQQSLLSGRPPLNVSFWVLGTVPQPCLFGPRVVTI